MADIIQLNGGKLETVFDIYDMLELINIHLGDDASRWIESYLSEIESGDDAEYISSLENEAKKRKEHHYEVMSKIWAESEKIASLIREKDIDRVSLSTAAGKVGSITWRELNV